MAPTQNGTHWYSQCNNTGRDTHEGGHHVARMMGQRRLKKSFSPSGKLRSGIVSWSSFG